MKVSDFDPQVFRRLLIDGDLTLDIHPFVARLRSDVPGFAADVMQMYGDFHTLDADGFADFHVEVSLSRGLRRWFKPAAHFAFDGRRSFLPLPANQAFPMLEWGLNWCVAAHAHQYLVLHAALIEKQGKSALLPAPPGSGKSTLCAGLVQRGWRLLSDELALCHLETGLIHGMARPINLKNRSIRILQEFSSDVAMTKPVPSTAKGTVALVKPPAESVARAREPVRANWIILPRYRADAAAQLLPYSKTRTFMLVADQSFNYDIHGARGFETVRALVQACQCFEFSYGHLEDAVRVFDELLASGSP